MKKIFLKQKTGFTLIETLVALSIFSVSIVALISITGSGVANTNYSKNKFTASFLAQEGVEMVRNIRDSVLISGGDWPQFINSMLDCANLSTGCMIAPQDLSIMACTGDCWNFVYDKSVSSDGFYSYFGGSDTDFIRKISVEMPEAPYVIVHSEVFWLQGSNSYSTAHTETLYDWIQPVGGFLE